MHGRTRVAIIDDHELFAQSLALALGASGYDAQRLTVGDGVSAAQLVVATQRWRPQVVLLDLDLGTTGDAGRLIPRLAGPGTTVIVLTASTDRVRHGECLAAGAAAVLPKSGSLSEIRAALRLVEARRPVTPREDRERLIQQWRSQRTEVTRSRLRFDTLTAREREVLADLVRGCTVAEIARAGVVSEATVRTQVKSILAKLQVSSQLAAVALAHRVAWRPPRSENAG